MLLSGHDGSDANETNANEKRASMPQRNDEDKIEKREQDNTDDDEDDDETTFCCPRAMFEKEE